MSKSVKRTITSMNNQESDDCPPSNRSKTTGKGIASTCQYTLTFSDAIVVFDKTISALSALLPNFDSKVPVPVLNFHSSAAFALIEFASTTTGSVAAAADLTPELYAMTVHLCDFLQMDQEVCRRILQDLECELSEDPLSRLRACHHSVPVFTHLLHVHYDMFQTAEEAQDAVTKILSHSGSSSQAQEELTYYELSLLDGKHSPFRNSLKLSRFAARERDRRQLIKDAAVAKTKALREGLKEDLDAGDDETKDKLDALRVALWNGGAIETTLLTKKLLDEEMWKAIEQGNINVANRVLELGAEPALKKDPKLDSDQSYDDWQHR